MPSYELPVSRIANGASKYTCLMKSMVNKKFKCTNCNSLNVQRQIGRIRIAHSEESRLEKMADPANLAGSGR